MGKAERASKVERCGIQVSAAAAHEVSCQEQLAAAKAALVDSEAALILAESSVRELGPEMEVVAADAEAADAVLLACKADLATFSELVEGAPVATEAAPAEVAIAEA